MEKVYPLLFYYQKANMDLILMRNRFENTFVVTKIRKVGPVFHKEKYVQLLHQHLSITPPLFMIVHPCIHENCEELVVKHGPLCTKHLEDVYGLKVAPTTLLDANGSRFPFLGLFTTIPRKEDDFIIPYFCQEDVMPGHDFTINTKSNYVDPYIYTDKKGRQWSALQYRAAGAMANSQMGRIKTRSLDQAKYMKSVESANNARYLDRCIVATKSITPGSEVFVYYGPHRCEYLDFGIQDSST